MIELVDELRSIDEGLRDATTYAGDLAYQWPLDTLLKNIKKVEKAWCGSWYGYQSRVYYREFEIPPIGTHFDRRFGFEVDLFGELREESKWAEYSFDHVLTVINEGIDQKDIRKISNETKRWTYIFKDKKESLLDIIGVAQQINTASVSDLSQRVEALVPQSVSDIVALERPNEMITNDPIAKQQGILTPPHIQIKAEVLWSVRTFEAIDELRNLVEKTIAQIERVQITEATTQMTGKKIFIGHGRSLLWRELKDYLEDDLGLECDEFNRVATEGITITERLSQMLDSAAFAFLIMTAEDERVDGTRQARMNVIHEAGLFQGRLGFDRAIILLEEGCEEFSNIYGLGHRPFAAGNIESAFYRIRKLLEERGILET